MKGNTMSARKNRAVHTLASICLIPKVISELPKAALETVKGFKEDVKEEMDWRVKVAREVSRNEA
jgi:hypothetical protein